jgi:hypothetical protein
MDDLSPLELKKTVSKIQSTQKYSFLKNADISN